MIVMGKLNEQQQTAVAARKSKILVSASVGTGKTTVLTDRVLSLLKDNKVNVNELLILTFTKNAAEHMRDKLEERISEDKEFDKVEKARQLELLEEADITTISAYAEKIVKDYYYQLKIDPDFNLLSEDVAKNSLRSEVWDEIIANIYHDDEENPMTAGIKNLLYLLTDGPNDYSLKNSVFNLYDFLASLKDPQEWKNVQHHNAEIPFEKSKYFNFATTLLEKNKDTFEPITKLSEEYQSRYNRYQELLADNKLSVSEDIETKQKDHLKYLNAVADYLSNLNTVSDITWENIKEFVKNSKFDESLKLTQSASYKGIPNVIDTASFKECIEYIRIIDGARQNFKKTVKPDKKKSSKVRSDALEQVRQVISKYPTFFKEESLRQYQDLYNELADKINEYYSVEEFKPSFDDKSKQKDFDKKISQININREWFDNIAPFINNVVKLYTDDFNFDEIDVLQQNLTIGKPSSAKSLVLDKENCRKVNENLTPEKLEEIKNETVDLGNNVSTLKVVLTGKKYNSKVLMEIEDKLKLIDEYRNIYKEIEEAGIAKNKITNIVKNKQWFDDFIEFFQTLRKNKFLIPLIHTINSLFISKPYSAKKFEDPDTTDYVLEVSEQVRLNYKPFLDSLAEVLPANIEDQYRQQQDMIPAFLDLYETFARAYDARKDEINLYEFSDIERKALDLINNNEIVRKELNDSYQEIIVDEYQDTNELQETILEQIAGDNTRRFMVGDVKQSIYRFRHADHTLFMNKEEKFGDEQATGATVIRLNTNYRSRQGVTDPINNVFNVVMNGEDQELNYQGQELVAGNDYYSAYHDDTPEETPEFENSLEPFKLYKLTLNDGDDKYSLEAAYVVDKIKTMLTEGKQIIDRDNGKPRPIKPSDIAIIARSWTNNDIYLNELKKAGIPYKVARSDLFLEQFEIHVALAYLRILDNSRQDISLVAVLHSPIYRINDQELAFLRVLQEHGSFYGALFGFMNRYKDDKETLLEKARDLDVADNPEEFLDVLHDKIENFLSDYNKLAALHTVSSLTDIMQAILSLTDIIPAFTALPQGQARRFNLNGLVQYISTFEGSGIATVDNLVKSLEHEKLTSINPDIDDSSLTYTTIHSSKGLEYPVVFIVNAEKSFNNQDAKGKVIWDKEDLGIASVSKEILDEDLDIFSLNNDSTMLKLLKDKLKQSNISEEKRLLYVAMTRAEQALYVVAAGKKDNLNNKEGNNYLSMLNNSLDDKYIALINKFALDEDASNNNNGSEIFMKADFSLPAEEETPKVISTRYATTNKELKGNIKNRDFSKEERLKSSSYQGQDYSHEKASDTVKADVLGTAAHLVFEKHLDKEHYPSTSVRETIKQLEAEELVPKEAADELLKNFVTGIQAFFDTGKGADMLKLDPSKVHPEFEFTALVKTQETFETADEDYTVVHGFIDCFYETTDNKVVIVDYKTDIRLTDDKVLAENYDGQLRLYTQALQLMGKEVEAAYVYGIRNQDIFEINIEDLKENN